MNDEEFGRQLPRMLSDEPLGQSTVDIGKAISAGRRHRRIRYSAGGVALLALAVAIPIAVRGQLPQPPPLARPSASPSPSASPVPAATCAVAVMPPGAAWVITDSTGRHFAGYLEDRTEQVTTEINTLSYRPPALWTDGRLEKIPAPPQHHSEVADVNAAGMVVGTASNDTNAFAFAYVDGQFHRLRDGQGSNAFAVNDSGVIVGHARMKEMTFAPVIWRSIAGPRELLPLPAGATSGDAVAITASGVVAGPVFFGEVNQTSRSYLWMPDGTVSPLPGPDGYSVSARRAGGDWLIGNYRTNDGLPFKEGTYLFNVRTREYRLAESFVHGEGDAVTADGWYAGSKRGQSGKQILTDGNAEIVLPQPEGDAPAIIASVSADGRVVTGYRVSPYPENSDAPRRWAAVVWRCG